jgi:hypothetical protein
VFSSSKCVETGFFDIFATRNGGLPNFWAISKTDLVWKDLEDVYTVLGPTGELGDAFRLQRMQRYLKGLRVDVELLANVSATLRGPLGTRFLIIWAFRMWLCNLDTSAPVLFFTRSRYRCFPSHGTCRHQTSGHSTQLTSAE